MFFFFATVFQKVILPDLNSIFHQLSYLRFYTQPYNACPEILVASAR